MQSFKNHLHHKLKGPAFKMQFEEECCICLTVVNAARSLEVKNLSIESFAKQLRIPQPTMQALFDGDHCTPVLIAQVYEGLGMECDCRKLKQ